MIYTFGVLSLDPIMGITPPSPIQYPMDPSYIGNTHQVFAKQ